MDRMLAVDDVARILAVCRRTAYEVMKRVPHMARPMRCTETALRAYIAENTVHPAEPAAKKQKRGWRPVPQAQEYIIPRRRA